MSERNLHADTEAATLAPVYRELLLVELDFASGVVYAHSGAGNFTWNGHTYLGVGRLGKLSEIEETEGLQANAIKLELSGVDPANVSLSLNEEYQGRPARVYIAYLDENYALKGNPVGPFEGKMDTMDGEFGKVSTITLTVESPLADWARPRTRRYTDADQQAEYPGDRFMEYAGQMAEKELVWGTG